jgi:hypothetical protein
LFSLIMALLIPDWVLQYFKGIIQYTSQNHPSTLEEIFNRLWPSFGSRIGIVLMILVIAMLLIEWWFSRKSNINRFLWTTCLTLVASQWIGTQPNIGNLIFILPGLILILIIVTERWKNKREGLIWGILGTLFLGPWIIFLTTKEIIDRTSQIPFIYLALPAIVILLLYWVRWWIIKPPNVWYDEINSM